MNTTERIEKFHNLMGDMATEARIDNLFKLGFFTAPASINHHGNYEGGLFDHGYEVARYLKKLTDELHLDWQNGNSPLLIGMFHDLCKVDSYIPIHEWASDDTNAESKGTKILHCEITGYKWNEEQLYTGHGDKSVLLLASEFKLTPEEVACIRYHMGAFGNHDEQQAYSRAVKEYPNVLWTHTADMLASQVAGV